MIQAIGNRLVVKEIMKEHKPGQLILTTGTDSQIKAMVIAKGSDVDDNVNVGDVVYIRKLGGVPLNIDDDEYLSVVQHEIMAVTGGL